MKRTLLALALAASCSSDTTADAGPRADAAGALPDAGVPVTGTIALSGSITLAPAPATIAGVKLDTDGTSTIGMTTQPLPAGFTTISAVLVITGAPATQTYAAADFQTGSAITVMTTDGKKYGATSGTTQGSFGSLTITDATMVDHAGGVTSYRIKGSFTATLADITPGGGDTVTFSATFN
jgi:hypothetical protein